MVTWQVALGIAGAILLFIIIILVSVAIGRQSGIRKQRKIDEKRKINSNFPQSPKTEPWQAKKPAPTPLPRPTAPNPLPRPNAPQPVPRPTAQARQNQFGRLPRPQNQYDPLPLDARQNIYSELLKSPKPVSRPAAPPQRQNQFGIIPGAPNEYTQQYGPASGGDGYGFIP